MLPPVERLTTNTLTRKEGAMAKASKKAKQVEEELELEELDLDETEEEEEDDTEEEGDEEEEEDEQEEDEEDSEDAESNGSAEKRRMTWNQGRYAVLCSALYVADHDGLPEAKNEKGRVIPEVLAEYLSGARPVPKTKATANLREMMAQHWGDDVRGVIDAQRVRNAVNALKKAGIGPELLPKLASPVKPRAVLDLGFLGSILSGEPATS